jgi:hypothetical protein
MQYVWTGHWPEHRSPELEGLWLDGKTATGEVRLVSGQNYAAKVVAQLPTGGTPQYSWEILPESAATSVGGDYEARPQPLPGLVTPGASGLAEIRAPEKPGAYRLFAYVFNGHGRAGYANIPFFVEAKPGTVALQP